MRGGLALFLGLFACFLRRFGGGGDAGGGARGCILGEIRRRNDLDHLVEVFDDCAPIAVDNAAHAGPLAHALVAGVVISTAGRVAQDGVRSEEDDGVLGAADLCQRVRNLQAARDRGDVLVARAASEVLRHADEVVHVLLFRNHAVRRLGVEHFPLGVIEQVMLRTRLEEAQHLGFSIKEQDGLVIT